MALVKQCTLVLEEIDDERLLMRKKSLDACTLSLREAFWHN
jgi:hypothetical protein